MKIFKLISHLAKIPMLNPRGLISLNKKMELIKKVGSEILSPSASYSPSVKKQKSLLNPHLVQKEHFFKNCRLIERTLKVYLAFSSLYLIFDTYRYINSKKR